MQLETPTARVYSGGRKTNAQQRLQLSDTSAYRRHVSDDGFRRSSLVAARDLFERVEERGEPSQAGWLAEAIATELSSEEQEILIQAVPLLDRLAQT